MVLDFIKISNADLATAPFSNDLINLVRAAQTFSQQLNQVKARMDHLGDGTTWTTVETKHGIPSGQGQTVYDRINGTLGALNGTMTNSNFVELINRIG